jgi:hypothetical protein
MTAEIKLRGRLKRLSASQVQRGTKAVALTLIVTDKLNSEDESAFVELLSKQVSLTIHNGTRPAIQEALPLGESPVEKPEPQTITIPGQPIGKPRMTRADAWKKRPCVLRYWAWCDKARRAADGKIPREIEGVNIRAFFAMPDSWSHQKRLQMDGTKHYQKPDFDNVQKAVADALLENDEIIADAVFSKRWTNGEGRIEVTFF